MGKNFVSNNFKYYKNSNASGELGHVNRLFEENKNAFPEYTKDNFGSGNLYEKYKSIYERVNEVKSQQERTSKLNDKSITFIDGAFSFSLDRWEELEKEYTKEKLQELITDRMNTYMDKFKKKFGYEPIGFEMHLDEGHEKQIEAKKNNPEQKLVRNIHAHVCFFNFDFETKTAPHRKMKKKHWSQCQDLAAECFEDLGFQRGISKDKTKKQHLDKDAFIAEKQAKLEAENNELKQSNDGLRADNEQLAIKNSNLTTVNADLRQKLDEVRETGKKAKKDLLKLGEKGKETIEDIKNLREKYNNDADDYRSLKQEKNWISEDIETLETKKILEEKELDNLKKNKVVYEQQMNKLKLNFQALSRFFGKMVNTFKNLIDIERSDLQPFQKRTAEFVETEELNNAFTNLKEQIFPTEEEKYTVLDNCINNAIEEIDANDKFEQQAKTHIQQNIPTVKPQKSPKRKPSPGM